MFFTQRQCEVLYLKRREKLSQREIARVLHISQPAVSRVLARANARVDTLVAVVGSELADNFVRSELDRLRRLFARKHRNFSDMDRG